MSTLALHSALYKENQGLDYLSHTFESNASHTPGHLERRTIPGGNFERSRTIEPPVVKTPWGRRKSYGGQGPLQLPKDKRPKEEPPTRVQKGHQHFGSGMGPHPRGIRIQQFYDLTSLKRSNLRSNDELIPDFNEVDLTKLQIDKKWPAKHPYSSHIPSVRMFPSYDSPDDSASATKHSSTLPPTVPAAAYPPTVVGKTKGSFARHEVIKIPLDSERKPISWPDGPDYYQVLKFGSNRERNHYYPIPSKIGDYSERVPQNKISNHTADALRDLRLSHFTTTYQRVHGNGEVASRHSTDRFNSLKTIAGMNSEVSTSLLTNREDNLDLKSMPNPTGRAFSPDEGKKSRSDSDDRQNKSLRFSDTIEVSDGSSSHEKKLTNRETREKYAKTANPVSRKAPPEELGLVRSKTALAELPSRPRPGDVLNEMQQTWSPTEAHRKFHQTYSENPPDLRRRPDLRVTSQDLLPGQSKERRHVIPEMDNCGAYVFHGLQYPQKFEM